MRIPLLRQELHKTERPSSTAQWTTLGRALELVRPPGQRIVTDEYAPVFLSGTSRAVLMSLTLSAPLVHTAERRELAGVSAFALCRHRFIDEHLEAELAGGAAQVLVLGAGYDSRAYRFASALDGRPVFEVDLAPLSRRKAAIVAAHPELFGQVAGHQAIHRVEIDFRTESLRDRLTDAGFAFGARTFVVWEGVSPYLDREAVSATLTTLGSVCGPGSVVAMDCWDGSGGTGLLQPIRWLGAKAIALVGEPVTFGIASTDIGRFLSEYRLAVVDLARWRELAARYSTDRRPSEESVYVLAARL